MLYPLFYNLLRFAAYTSPGCICVNIRSGTMWFISLKGHLQPPCLSLLPCLLPLPMTMCPLLPVSCVDGEVLCHSVPCLPA